MTNQSTHSKERQSKGEVAIETNGIYLTNKTYQENIELGPNIQADWVGDLNQPIDYHSQSTDFLGYKLNNPLGVPAGPLLSASWIELASKLNFSVITYKTIRSHKHPCHPIPNMISVDSTPIEAIDPIKQIRARACDDLNQLTITNSFGMPSQSEEFLIEDLARAKQSIRKGQILVVSVVASDISHPVEDFFKVAKFAEQQGADAIELNLSCPNVKDPSSIVYLDEELSYQICKKISSNINVPLIIKIGYIEDENLFEKVLLNANRAGVSAVSGINSYSLEVFDQKGTKPALDEKRLSGGICGYGIKPIGIDFTFKARKIITKNQLNLALIGMGGVMQASDFNDYLQSGADIAMSATGMMWFPLIAKEYAKQYQKQFIQNNQNN